MHDSHVIRTKCLEEKNTLTSLPCIWKSKGEEITWPVLLALARVCGPQFPLYRCTMTQGLAREVPVQETQEVWVQSLGFEDPLE